VSLFIRISKAKKIDKFAKSGRSVKDFRNTIRKISSRKKGVAKLSFNTIKIWLKRTVKNKIDNKVRNLKKN